MRASRIGMSAKKVNSVWLAGNRGVEHDTVEYIFADKEDAAKWLELRWKAEFTRQGETLAYWKLNYEEQARMTDTAEMREYYLKKVNTPEIQVVTEIKWHGDHHASFDVGTFDQTYITEKDLSEFTDLDKKLPSRKTKARKRRAK